MLKVQSVANTKTAQPIVFGGGSGGGFIATPMLPGVTVKDGREGYTSRFKGDN